MLDAHTERQWLKAAAHNPKAFTRLYQHYLPDVYAYAAARIGTATDAEDVVSTIWLKVVAGLPHFEYRGEGSFRAWLFSIAWRCVTDHFRQRRADLPILLEDVPDIASSELPPDEALSLKEQFLHLQACIRQLSPRRQEIVLLKFYGGLRNREIATILQLDERTVAAHLCRALEDLQRHYQQEVHSP